ncbi:hypothetical protein [Kitasatospora sp. NPDC090091]|uniref:hypothetical protein n=1 Tax=Kitasatospora sp. NPDC090091 TaxID=3364081 RepID=UPI003818B07D
MTHPPAARTPGRTGSVVWEEPARRGQPPKLTPARRRLVLDALTGGATLAAAAAAVGITRATLHNTRRRDPAFDADVTAALAAAKAQTTNPAPTPVPAGPACAGCGRRALQLTDTGATCTHCHADYHLTPARPRTVPGHQPPPRQHPAAAAASRQDALGHAVHFARAS